MNKFYIDKIIETAISEDVNYLDISSEYIFPPEHRSEAFLTAKAQGVLCGIDIAMRVFELLDDGFAFSLNMRDGQSLKPGDIIAEFSGSTAQLLKGERTALNLLQHMSGIATATAQAVKAVEGTGVSIADTRKTLPGLRALQKYAVTCAGGRNHRFNLSDAAMLKDNHIDAAGGITAAVRALREKCGHTISIEVETRNLDEVREALEAGVTIIMLDNMTDEQMRRAVKLVAGRALLEASGNITAENLRKKALTGVDIISMGALTHSVQALDISMKLKKQVLRGDKNTEELDQ